MPVTRDSLLLCGEVTPERLQWIQNVVTSGSLPCATDAPARCSLFLTGDALMSLVDVRMRENWKILSKHPGAVIIADGEELRLHGLTTTVMTMLPEVAVRGPDEGGNGMAFWRMLIEELRDRTRNSGKVAFFLCNSPYMSRNPVYMLRFLKSGVEAGIRPELYTYLDGVHVAHIHQRPSEFENIGEGITALATVANGDGQPWFGACSRCATARGYYVKNPLTGGCNQVSCIDEITVRPLKEILERFYGDHPIISPQCGDIGTCREHNQEDTMIPSVPPVLIIFITATPYTSEWTFGGLSLAVAAAMGGIPTRLVFIEQGVWAICGSHEVIPDDRVFNVQEMIEATVDLPDLKYFVYKPSLDERGISIAESLPDLDIIDGEGLAGLLRGSPGTGGNPRIRMFIF